MNTFVPKYQSRYNDKQREFDYVDSQVVFYANKNYSFSSYDKTPISYSTRIRESTLRKID